MYVCHCRAVTDRTIREAVRCGADSLEAVQERTEAATVCGGCEPAVCALVRDADCPLAELLTRVAVPA